MENNIHSAVFEKGDFKKNNSIEFYFRSYKSHCEIYLKGFVGREMQESFPDLEGLKNHDQWDIVFPDGDIFKAGVGGQGMYLSPTADVVVVYFSTGKQQEEIMARAIVNNFKP